jgi:maltoporin
MRRARRWLTLAGALVMGVVATPAVADEPTGAHDTEADPRHNTEEPKAAEEQPLPVLTPAPTPVAPPVAAPAQPKFGDLSVSGYFRGGFGASNEKGRMTCFKLGGIPGGMFSKYRLGNECEVWSETHFTMVTYVGDDGSVASLHFMPTIFIPTTYIGYVPNGAINAPDQYQTSTGAVLYLPNLYADIKGIPWLFGGTAWAGTRYYKRESVYISDFFYWNPSGVGLGVEDIHLGDDLRLSYGAFAVDGEPVSQGTGNPSLPLQIDFGVRNDLQLRGIHPWASAELQLGFQYIADFSAPVDANGNPNPTHGGWGVTFQYVQKLLGGDNRLALQYGRGGGTGFGTLARFYYPDFSVRHDLAESRFRAVDVLTIQPLEWLGAQVAGVFQRDDLGTQGSRTDWYSGGGRVGLAFTRHAKVLGEAGGDYVKKENGSDAQYLAKVTGAVAISADRGFWSRPELRLFYTWAVWNEAARTVGVDSGRIYTDVYTDVLSGSIFGLQAETWW